MKPNLWVGMAIGFLGAAVLVLLALLLHPPEAAPTVAVAPVARVDAAPTEGKPSAAFTSVPVEIPTPQPVQGVKLLFDETSVLQPGEMRFLGPFLPSKPHDELVVEVSAEQAVAVLMMPALWVPDVQRNQQLLMNLAPYIRCGQINVLRATLRCFASPEERGTSTATNADGPQAVMVADQRPPLQQQSGTPQVSGKQALAILLDLANQHRLADAVDPRTAAVPVAPGPNRISVQMRTPGCIANCPPIGAVAASPAYDPLLAYINPAAAQPQVAEREWRLVDEKSFRLAAGGSLTPVTLDGSTESTKLEVAADGAQVAVAFVPSSDLLEARSLLATRHTWPCFRQAFVVQEICTVAQQSALAITNKSETADAWVTVRVYRNR